MSLFTPTRLRVLSSIVLVLAVGCGGGDSNPSGPGGGGGPSGDGPISARIDGAAWEADESTIFIGDSIAPGQLSFQGASTSMPITVMNVTLSRIPGPGTYPLGMNTFSATGGIAVVTTGATSATTPLSGDAGSITIDTLTGTRVTGTFEFVAATAGGGTVTVTDGAFDVPLSDGFVAVGPDQVGSSTSGAFGGSDWNAATVVGIVSSGVYSVTASNTAHTMTITIGPIAGPDSGPLSNTSPVRRIGVVNTAGTGAWGSGNAADTGTISVTTATATRLQGTFTVTLAPGPSSEIDEPLVITGGAFDVRIGQ